MNYRNKIKYILESKTIWKDNTIDTDLFERIDLELQKYDSNQLEKILYELELEKRKHNESLTMSTLMSGTSMIISVLTLFFEINPTIASAELTLIFSIGGICIYRMSKKSTKINERIYYIEKRSTKILSRYHEENMQ